MMMMMMMSSLMIDEWKKRGSEREKQGRTVRE